MLSQGQAFSFRSAVRIQFLLLSMFLIGSFPSVNAQSHYYHEDSVGCVRLFYTGQSEGRNAVRLIIKNKKKELIWLTVFSEEGQKVYSIKKAASTVDRVFLMDEPYAGLVFTIGVAERKEVQRYRVSFQTRRKEDVVILASR
jgi:hypothetical protein